MTAIPTDKMPSTVLKDEHRVILRVLAVLDRLMDRAENGEGFERETLAGCVEFFRLFADACHHAKEEDLLFPVLEQRGIPRDGGPIGVMLYEHSLARGFVREMGEALNGDDDGAPSRFIEAARQYVELLRNHIAKEDNVLYVLGDRVMTDDDQRSLCSRFCEVSCKSFGGKRVEQLERMATQLEARWGHT